MGFFLEGGGGLISNKNVEATMRKVKQAHMKEKAENQSKFPFSLLQTSYANEVYELMHDPIRIITLPVGSKAGAISSVA